MAVHIINVEPRRENRTAEELIRMDIFYGFLIGLAFPPMLVIVVASMIAGRSGGGVIAGVASLILLAGPIVWIMIFIALGISAGLAAFGGWILGLGIAAAMVIGLLISRVRRTQKRPPASWSH